MKAALATVVLAVVTLLGSAARADGGVDPGSIKISGPTSSQAAGWPPSGWYGWQTIIALGASDALLFGAIPARSKLRYELLGFGIGGHVLANPIIHLANGHPGRFGWSFLFLLGGIAAVEGGVAKGCTTDCGEAAVAGLVAGLLVVNVMEIIFLSSDKSKAHGYAENVRVAPLAGPNRAGLSLTLRF
jgi:hypothetical protein